MATPVAAGAMALSMYNTYSVMQLQSALKAFTPTTSVTAAAAPAAKVAADSTAANTAIVDSITKLSSDSTVTKGAVDTINGKVSTLMSSTTTLRTDVDSLKSRLTAISSVAPVASTGNTSTDAAISKINLSIADLYSLTKNSDTATLLDNVNSRLHNAELSLSSLIDSSKTSIDLLTSRGVTMRADIGTCQTNITILQNADTQMKATLATHDQNIITYGTVLTNHTTVLTDHASALNVASTSITNNATAISTVSAGLQTLQTTVQDAGTRLTAAEATVTSLKTFATNQITKNASLDVQAAAIYANLPLSALKGGLYSVMDSVDGGASRGIRMWNASDANWGIYMSQSGAGKSMVGGAACASNHTATGSHIRFRCANNSNNGFLFENSSETALATIAGSDGHLRTVNAITAGTAVNAPEGNFTNVTASGTVQADTIRGNNANASGNWIIKAENGHVHLTSTDKIFCLSSNGLVVGKAWGGNGNLLVEGDATLNNSLTVGGSATVNNNLTVVQATTLGGNVTMNNHMTLAGTATCGFIKSNSGGDCYGGNFNVKGGNALSLEGTDGSWVELRNKGGKLWISANEVVRNLGSGKHCAIACAGSYTTSG